MNFDKPSFLSVLDQGTSLVWFPGQMACAEVTAVIANSGCPFDKIIQVVTGNGFEMCLRDWASPRMPNTARVMTMPSTHGLCHGWRAVFDRVIWVGPIPDGFSSQWGNYAQAMARGDMPWGQPAKLHYLLTEILQA